MIVNNTVTLQSFIVMWYINLFVFTCSLVLWYLKREFFSNKKFLVLLLLYALSIRLFFGMFGKHHGDMSSWITTSEVFHHDHALLVGWSYGLLGYFIEVAGYEMYSILSLNNMYLLNLFMKIFPIVFDFLILWIFMLLYSDTSKQNGNDYNKNKCRLISCPNIVLVLILFLLNPVTVYYSSIHGMQESIMMFLVFLYIYILYFRHNKVLGLTFLFLSWLIKFATLPFLAFELFKDITKRFKKLKLILLLVFIFLFVVFTYVFHIFSFTRIEFLKRAYEATLESEPSWISLCGILRSIGLSYHWVPFVFYPIFMILPFITVLRKNNLNPFFVLSYFIIVLTLFIPNFQLNFLYWIVSSMIGLLISEMKNKRENFVLKTSLIVTLLYISFAPTLIETFYEGSMSPTLRYVNLLELVNLSVYPKGKIGFGYGATIILLLESLFVIFVLKLLTKRRIDILTHKIRKSMQPSTSALITISYILLITFSLPLLFSRLSPAGIFSMSMFIYLVFLTTFPLIFFYSMIAIENIFFFYCFKEKKMRGATKNWNYFGNFGIFILIIAIVISSVYSLVSILNYSISSNRCVPKEIFIENLTLTGNEYFRQFDLNISSPSIVDVEFTLSTTSEGAHIKLCGLNTSECKFIRWGIWGWHENISNIRFRFQVFNKNNISNVFFYGEYPPTGHSNTTYQDIRIRIYQDSQPSVTALAYWQWRGLPRKDMKIIYTLDIDTSFENSTTIKIPRYALSLFKDGNYPSILAFVGDVEYPENKNQLAIILNINNFTLEKNFYQIYCCRYVEWKGRYWKLYYIYLPPHLLKEKNVIEIEFEHKNVKLRPLGIAAILFERP